MAIIHNLCLYRSPILFKTTTGPIDGMCTGVGLRPCSRPTRTLNSGDLILLGHYGFFLCF